MSSGLQDSSWSTSPHPQPRLRLRVHVPLLSPSFAFSGSPTSLLFEHTKLTFLQGFHITFLSARVLPPPPHPCALSTWDPLIKWHLIKSLPWSFIIKDQYSLPIHYCPDPATPYLPLHPGLFFTITLLSPEILYTCLL